MTILELHLYIELYLLYEDAHHYGSLHFVREQVEDVLQVTHIPGCEHRADIFAKSCPPESHQKLQSY